MSASVWLRLTTGWSLEKRNSEEKSLTFWMAALKNSTERMMAKPSRSGLAIKLSRIWRSVMISTSFRFTICSCVSIVYCALPFRQRATTMISIRRGSCGMGASLSLSSSRISFSIDPLSPSIFARLTLTSRMFLFSMTSLCNVANIRFFRELAKEKPKNLLGAGNKEKPRHSVLNNQLSTGKTVIASTLMTLSRRNQAGPCTTASLMSQVVKRRKACSSPSPRQM